MVLLPCSKCCGPSLCPDFPCPVHWTGVITDPDGNNFPCSPEKNYDLAEQIEWDASHITIDWTSLDFEREPWPGDGSDSVSYTHLTLPTKA